jgi:high-affinity Fe2+/Pb2+ permease
MENISKVIAGLVVLGLLSGGVWWYLRTAAPTSGGLPGMKKSTASGPEVPLVYPPGVGNNTLPDPSTVR